MALFLSLCHYLYTIEIINFNLCKFLQEYFQKILLKLCPNRSLRGNVFISLYMYYRTINSIILNLKCKILCQYLSKTTFYDNFVKNICKISYFGISMQKTWKIPLLLDFGSFLEKSLTLVTIATGFNRHLN